MTNVGHNKNEKYHLQVKQYRFPASGCGSKPFVGKRHRILVSEAQCASLLVSPAHLRAWSTLALSVRAPPPPLLSRHHVCPTGINPKQQQPQHRQVRLECAELDATAQCAAVRRAPSRRAAAIFRWDHGGVVTLRQRNTNNDDNDRGGIKYDSVFVWLEERGNAAAAQRLWNAQPVGVRRHERCTHGRVL